MESGRKSETYLIAIICCDPICKSLNMVGYSLSMSGKLMLSFQKNSSNFSWLTIPMVSPSSVVTSSR